MSRWPSHPLRAALSELAEAFEAAQGWPVKPGLGACGLLKDRLADGEPSHVSASANLAHPRALQAAGVALRVEPGGPPLRPAGFRGGWPRRRTPPSPGRARRAH